MHTTKPTKKRPAPTRRNAARRKAPPERVTRRCGLQKVNSSRLCLDSPCLTDWHWSEHPSVRSHPLDLLPVKPTSRLLRTISTLPTTFCGVGVAASITGYSDTLTAYGLLKSVAAHKNPPLMPHGPLGADGAWRWCGYYAGRYDHRLHRRDPVNQSADQLTFTLHLGFPVNQPPYTEGEGWDTERLGPARGLKGRSQWKPSLTECQILYTAKNRLTC